MQGEIGARSIAPREYVDTQSNALRSVGIDSVRPASVPAPRFGRKASGDGTALNPRPTFRNAPDSGETECELEIMCH